VGAAVTRQLPWLALFACAPALAHAESAPAPHLTAGLRAGWSEQQTQLELAGQYYDSRRSELQASLAIGLEHAWFDRVSGHASVAFGPNATTGAWLWSLREDARYTLPALAWLGVSGGLGVGLAIDSHQPEHSRMELGIPLGLVLFDLLEIVYRPYLELPLGSHEQRVFGGELEHSAALAWVPLDLEIRVRAFRLGL
jgi:hypothetical protein